MSDGYFHVLPPLPASDSIHHTYCDTHKEWTPSILEGFLLKERDMPERMQRGDSSALLSMESNAVTAIEEFCSAVREGSIDYEDFVHNVMEALGLEPSYYEEFAKMKEIEALWDT
jgi:hypothetical protein